MKTAVLTMIAVLSFATAAQASAKTVSKKIITGREAVKEISIGSFLSTKDVFESDDTNCSVELKSRGHDLEILVKENDKLKFTLEISENEKYRFEDHSEGDDSVTKILSMDKKQSITIEAADDAFDRVTAEKDGITVDCEVDF
jgi:hypothetical protein